MPTDLERLQTTLDSIAGTVEWAAGWIDHLESEEIRFDAHSDQPILAAEVERLQAIADALVPGRVRDSSTGRRWYLAPDDVRQRERELVAALDAADRRVAKVAAETQAERRDDERSDQRREEERREREAERAAGEAAVRTYLLDHGPRTEKEIAEATGVGETWASIHAKSVGAKRGRDRRYRLQDAS
jgi:hypothetical protein